MLQQFDIEESKDVLVLRLKSPGSAMGLARELVIIVIGFIIVFNLSYEWLTTLSPLLTIVYLLPLVRLPWLIKEGKAMLSPTIFRFNKSKDEFSINHTVKHACSEISGLSLNYLTANDSDEIYLDLNFAKRPRYRLSGGSSLNLNEYKKVGRQLARFNQVEFWNNQRTEKELLWGANQVSDTDVAGVNDHHSRYR